MREQFLRNRRLIAHYYLVAGVAALLFSLSARSEETIDPIILVILTVYVIVFPVVILYTRKYAVHIFLFLLAFNNWLFKAFADFSLFNVMMPIFLLILNSIILFKRLTSIN